jgi:hypothetical protein
MGHQHGVGSGRIETNCVRREAFSVENCDVKICSGIWEIILKSIYEKYGVIFLLRCLGKKYTFSLF